MLFRSSVDVPIRPLISRAALPLWRQGSLGWKPHLAEAAESLRQSLGDAGPEHLSFLDNKRYVQAFTASRAASSNAIWSKPIGHST